MARQTLIERVARAVYAKNNWWKPTLPSDDGKGRYRGEFRAVEWEELDAGEKILLLETARDHIEALRSCG